MLGAIAATILAYAEGARQFEERLAAMPKEEADAIRSRIAKDREEEKAHRRALEIADAGRARNFWGK